MQIHVKLHPQITLNESIYVYFMNFWGKNKQWIIYAKFCYNYVQRCYKWLEQHRFYGNIFLRFSSSALFLEHLTLYWLILWFFSSEFTVLAIMFLIKTPFQALSWNKNYYFLLQELQYEKAVLWYSFANMNTSCG
jgi:hypothetical protein